MSLLVLASAATASGLTLKYFDARGAAETTRVLLAIGGIAYTDHRYAIGPGFEAPEFKADKESGALARKRSRATSAARRCCSPTRAPSASRRPWSGTSPARRG